MISPGFSKFRKLIDAWDDDLLRESMEERINTLVNSPNISFLFVRHGNVFGGGEDSRLTFAKMKSRKNDDELAGWRDDADFMGVNLLSILKDDHPSHSVFGKKDLADIKVIDQEEAKKRLLRSLRNNDLG